jgi:hypothetical protein
MLASSSTARRAVRRAVARLAGCAWSPSRAWYPMPMSIALLAAVALAAPTFPATTPAEVIALATPPRITGTATYDMRIAAERYRLRVVQVGTRVLAHFTVKGSQMWVGYVPGPGVTFVCRRQPRSAIGCERGDPGGAGLKILGTLGGPLSNEYLRQAFRPLTRGAIGRVSQARHLGQPVSCLAGEVQGKRRLLCSTRYSMPTRLIAPGVRAVALRASADVTVRDTRPPVPLPAAGTPAAGG